jgi:hypothetical protein
VRVLVAAASDPVEHRATVRASRLTAERARQLGKELRALVQAMAPTLLAQPTRRPKPMWPSTVAGRRCGVSLASRR